MTLRRMNRLVHRYAPKYLERHWDVALTSSLAKRLSKAESISQKVDIATGKGAIRSNQRREEILPLLSKLHAHKPRVVCEIGCDTGGTLALFAQCAAPDGLILSLDINHKPCPSKGFDHFATKQQKVVTVAGDSHDPRTLEQVRRIINDRPIDFLFIDGDHSFSGVFDDFLMYSAFLREGSLLAFHDIVDSKVQFERGGVYPAYVGDVPEFYSSYIEPHFNSEKFIESNYQSGYGIGLVTWPDQETAAQIVSEISRQAHDRETMSAKAA